MNVEPKVMRRRRDENAQFVVARLKEFGLSPGTDTRLMQMHDVLHRGYVSFDHPNFSIARESVRDMQQLGFILDQLDIHRNNEKFRKVVQRLMNDSPLPQDDPTNSPGRDAQLELYVAAICQHAKMVPVEFEEPDVRCAVGDVTFSLACKRVKSRSKFKKHVLKAADQVRKSGNPGVAIVDVSHAWNPTNALITSPLQTRLWPRLIRSQMHDFFTENKENIRRWVLGSGVIGVVLLDQQVIMTDDLKDWELSGATMWLDTYETAQGRRHFQAFFVRFREGIPNRRSFFEE